MIVAYMHECLHVLYLLQDKWISLDETLHKPSLGHVVYKYFKQILQSYIFVDLKAQLNTKWNVIIYNSMAQYNISA